MSFPRTLFIFMTMLLSCCSCVFSKNETPRATDVPVSLEMSARNVAVSDELQSFIDKAEVQKAWQSVFIHQFERHEAKSAWILVSYAGYVNRGQYAIYQEKNGELSFYYAAPNENERFIKVETPEKILKAFHKAMGDFIDLSDYRRPSFDGVSYEFITLHRKAQQVETRRVFMNSLGIYEGDEAHRQLIEHYMKLRPQPKASD